MLTDRWHEIESLYYSACERKPEERLAYLEDACGGDEALLREVESLLAYDDGAASFMETEQLDACRKEQQEPSVPAGERIGPYVVLEFLRAGGMGKADGRVSPQTGRLMRIPAAGGPPEFVLEARGYPGSARAPREGFTLTARGHPDFRCPVALSTPCLLSEIEGNQVVFFAFDPVRGRKGETTRIDFDPGASLFWDLSPDGSRIAFGQPDVRGGRLHILQLGMGSIQDVDVKGWVNLESLCWSADGSQLFVTKHSSSGDSLLRVSLSGEAQVLHKAGMWIERPAASPDGRHLAWGEVSSSSNVWAIENFH